MLGGATAPNIELHVVSGVLPHPGVMTLSSDPDLTIYELKALITRKHSCLSSFEPHRITLVGSSRWHSQLMGNVTPAQDPRLDGILQDNECLGDACVHGEIVYMAVSTEGIYVGIPELCYRGAPSVEQDRGHQGPPQAQPAADAAAAGAPIEELRAQEETPRAKRRERRGEAAGGEERKKKKQERSRWTKLQVETLVKAMEDLFYDWRLKVEAQEADEDGEKKVLPFPWKLIKRHPYNLDATTGPSQLKGTGIRDKWKAMKVAWQKADSGERVLEHCCKDEALVKRVEKLMADGAWVVVTHESGGANAGEQGGQKQEKTREKEHTPAKRADGAGPSGGGKAAGMGGSVAKRGPGRPKGTTKEAMHARREKKMRRKKGKKGKEQEEEEAGEGRGEGAGGKGSLQQLASMVQLLGEVEEREGRRKGSEHGAGDDSGSEGGEEGQEKSGGERAGATTRKAARNAVDHMRVMTRRRVKMEEDATLPVAKRTRRAR